VNECSIYRCQTTSDLTDFRGSSAVSTTADHIFISRVDFAACRSDTEPAAIGVLDRADTVLTGQYTFITASYLVVISNTGVCSGRFNPKTD
jgi:hypothetical protein